MALFNVHKLESRLFTAQDIAKYASYDQRKGNELKATIVSTLAQRFKEIGGVEIEFLKHVGQSGARRTRRYTLKQLLTFTIYHMLTQQGISQEDALFYADSIFKDYKRRIKRVDYDFVGIINEKEQHVALVLVGFLGVKVPFHITIEYDDDKLGNEALRAAVRKVQKTNSPIITSQIECSGDPRFTVSETTPSVRLFVFSAAVKQALLRLEKDS